ncbi:Kruppel-like zinc finger protein, partial [Dinothrombium tinctorium]
FATCNRLVVPYDYKFDRQKIASAKLLEKVSGPTMKSVTKVPEVRFNFLWVIENFAAISKYVSCIDSQEFTSPQSTINKWALRCKPRRVDEATGFEYISVHLYIRKSENNVPQRAKYKIRILDRDNDSRFMGGSDDLEGRVFLPGQGLGFTKLAPFDFIIDRANNFLDENGSLKILCEVSLICEMYNTPISKYELKLDDEIEKNGSLLEHMKKLLLSKNNCDVTIVSKDDVFAAMFKHDTKEKREKEIKIPDFNEEVVSEMLRFVYTDQVSEEKMDEIACELAVAADKYDIPLLKFHCEKYIATNINEDNCASLLLFSDENNCASLKARILEFVGQNSVNVCENETWKSEMRKRPALFEEAFEA